MAKELNLTKEYYDKRFGEQSQHLNEEETIRWQAIEEVLKKHMHGAKLKIADFGCGRGWLSAKLSAFGDVTGFDVSEKAVQNAKQSFPGLNFVCLDASEKIPETYMNAFDLVVSSEVIEHIHDQTTYAKNIHALLKLNGTFLISTPNGNWYDSFYTAGREEWKQPVENWLKTNPLRSLFKEVGLSEVFFSTFNSEWIFAYKPNIPVKYISNSVVRKALKVLGCYKYTLKVLNSKHYGLNSLLVGKKQND